MSRSDVLHAVPGNPEATLVGDLATDAGIPTAAFDCLILTQTCTHIFDIQGAVALSHAALRRSLSTFIPYFAEHLEVVRRAYRPLSLRALRRRLPLNRWLRGTLVLTFDDDYPANLHDAKPLLEAAEVPATVFVTAGMVDAPHEFWWDALERVLLRTPGLPTRLTLTMGGADHHWSLPVDQAAEPTHPDWHVLRGEPTATPRQALYVDLAGWPRGLPTPPKSISNRTFRPRL